MITIADAEMHSVFSAATLMALRLLKSDVMFIQCHLSKNRTDVTVDEKKEMKDVPESYVDL